MARSTFNERVKILEEIKPLYTGFFRKHYEQNEIDLASQKGLEPKPLFDDEETDYTKELIWFEDIAIELNPNPSIGIIDYNFVPHIGPRLELHLREPLDDLQDPMGLQLTRQQLGRIARYIDARNLAKEFPFISAVTYPRLSRLAGKIIGMTPALGAYVFPTSEDARKRLSNTYSYYLEFLGRNNKDTLEREVALDPLIQPTVKFTENWRDQE